MNIVQVRYEAKNSIPIILCGLGIGAAASGVFLAPAEVTEAAPEDRVDAVLALFEDTCLSHNDAAEFPRPDGLQPARMFPDDDRWYDVHSGMVVDFEANRCSMIDVLSPMTDVQLDQIIEQMPQYVTTRLPDLREVDTDVSENRAYLTWSMDAFDETAQAVWLSRSFGPTYLTISYRAPG